MKKLFALALGLFKTSEPHGPSIIAAVHDEFHGFIDRLHLGRVACGAKIEENADLIRLKNLENAILNRAIEQADVTIANLRKLIGQVTDEPQPPEAAHA